MIEPISGTWSLDYSKPQCLRCDSGHACAAGLKKECKPLGYAFGGASECSECAARPGWGCTGGIASPCLPGTYSDKGAACQTCAKGSACPDGLAYACAGGKYAHSSGLRCINCKPGEFSCRNSLSRVSRVGTHSYSCSDNLLPRWETSTRVHPEKMGFMDAFTCQVGTFLVVA